MGSFKIIDIDALDRFKQNTDLSMQSALSEKVDKETGKGLSTNDYDNTEKGKVTSALQPSDIVDNLADTSSDKPISARAVNVDMVDYVDASISDTMLYINQEIASEHAGRVAGDDLINAAVVKHNIAQDLTTAQKTQARENIDALGNSDLTPIEQRIDEVEEIIATALADLDGRVENNSQTKADKILVDTNTSTGTYIYPNIFYKFGTASSLVISFKEPIDNTIVNEYMFEFVSGSTATRLTIPVTVKGIDASSIEPNKKYHVSIVDNVGVIYGVDNA